MGNFNLGVPDVLGMEPRWQGQYTITLTDGIAILQRFRPGADTIRKIHTYIQNIAGSNPGLAVELLTGEPMPQLLTPEYFPAVDVTTAGWKKQDSSTSNQFQAIDDRYDVSDWIQNVGAIGPNERRAFVTRGTATAISGKRVQAVVLTLNAGMGQYRQTSFAKIRGFLDIAGQRYYGGDWLLPNDGQWHQPTFIAGWLRNPATQKPWTQAEVNSIVATGSTNKFGIDVTVSPAQYNQIDDGAVHISGLVVGTLEAGENRGGSGSGASYTITKPRTGWDGVQLAADVTTSANLYYWLFVSAYNASGGQPSTLVVPRFNDDHGTIAANDDPTIATGEHREWLAAALKSGVPQATIPKRSRPVTTGSVGSIPFLLENSAGAIMASSQPYAQLNRIDISTALAANTGQKLTPGANKDYGAVLATVGWGSYNQPDAPLIVQVRSAINGGSLLGQAILHPDPEDTWVRDRYLILDQTVSAVIATPVYVHFLSAASSSKPWRILQYDTRSDNRLTGTITSVAAIEGASLGGTTDGYFTNGALLTRYDLAACLFASPDPPTVTVTAVEGT